MILPQQKDTAMPAPYFSEIKYLGGANEDFVEVAVDAGLNVANIQVVIYHQNGTVRSVNALGTLDGTVAGRDVYVIDTATSATFSGLHQNGAAALVVNGTVTSFVSFNGAVTATRGPASGMTSDVIGTTGRGESLETTDNGGSYDIQTNPNPDTVPCFLAGTRIATACGGRPVESLRAGDLVQTEEAGLQPILWAGMRQLNPGDAAQRPIRIPAGALAPRVPQRDLWLSPNHRVAIGHPLCALYFACETVLVPAKALTGWRGAGPAPVALPVRYHHLLLARHRTLRANGAACESFLPERLGLMGLARAQRQEIRRALPALAHDPAAYGPSAHPIVTCREARALLAAIGDGPVDLEAAPRLRRTA